MPECDALIGSIPLMEELLAEGKPFDSRSIPLSLPEDLWRESGDHERRPGWGRLGSAHPRGAA